MAGIYTMLRSFLGPSKSWELVEGGEVEKGTVAQDEKWDRRMLPAFSSLGPQDSQRGESGIEQAF